MTVGKEGVAELLRGPDGERIWLALHDYAQKLARKYGWRSDKVLPQGFSPVGVADDVIIKVLEGDRKWDQTKEPVFLNALKGMVRSDLGHLFDDYEAARVEPITKTLPDGNERTAEMLPGNDPGPERQALRAEQTRLEMTALDLILAALGGDPDLESVFLALYTCDSPKEIALQTGLPVKRVYALRRELDRIAANITPARVARESSERRKNG
jgi:hypothetical protein